MKYLFQAVIIAAVTFAAEIIKALLPLPIPASIYGLALLFILLKTGLLKLSAVEDVGNLLLELMPLFLIPACVGLVKTRDVIQPMLLPVLVMCLLGTTVVMLVTGYVSQWLIRRKKRRAHHD